MGEKMDFFDKLMSSRSIRIKIDTKKEAQNGRDLENKVKSLGVNPMLVTPGLEVTTIYLRKLSRGECEQVKAVVDSFVAKYDSQSLASHAYREDDQHVERLTFAYPDSLESKDHKGSIDTHPLTYNKAGYVKEFNRRFNKNPLNNS